MTEIASGLAPVAESETASRLLLRSLAEASVRMHGAEPGTDDFLVAYRQSCRLRTLYRHVRDTREVPAEVWALVA